MITLLDPAGSGGSYVRPSAQGLRYISLPLELWSQGWILELSATALSLLMVIRDVQQNKDLARYATRQDREAYHLSPDT